MAYDFVHLLAELAEDQEAIAAETVDDGITFLERHVYLLALLGLTIFYGLERAPRPCAGADKRRARETARVNRFRGAPLSS